MGKELLIGSNATIDGVARIIRNSGGLAQLYEQGQGGEAIVATLRLYEQVAPAEEYQSLLRVLGRGIRPYYSVFADPAGLKLAAPLALTPPKDIPDYPVRKTHLPRDNDRNWRPVEHALRRFTSEGYIAFSQSLASALPYWLVSRLLDSGQLEFGEQVRMLDMCGAPGNKTLNMCHLPGVASVESVINDIKPSRLVRVAERLVSFGFDRIGPSSYSRLFVDGRSVTIHLTHADATKRHDVERIVDTYFAGKSPHVVIADVDCPGEGRVWTDLRVAKSPLITSVEQTKHQRDMLAHALSVVAPKGHGVVSYSTCSVNPLVNEAVVQSALSDPRVSFYCVPLVDGLLYEPVYSFGQLDVDSRVRGVRAYPTSLGEGFCCSLLGRE